MKACLDVSLWAGTFEVELKEDEVKEWVEIQRIESSSERKRALKDWTEKYLDTWVDRGWQEPTYEVDGVEFVEQPELPDPEGWYRKVQVDPGQMVFFDEGEAA